MLAQIRRKHPGLVNNCILHQDTTPLAEFLEEHNIKVMEHPLYSLDLTMSNF